MLRWCFRTQLVGVGEEEEGVGLQSAVKGKEATIRVNTIEPLQLGH